MISCGGFLLNQCAWIGTDIQDQEIRFACFSKRRGLNELKDYAACQLPSGLIQDGLIQEWKEAVCLIKTVMLDHAWGGLPLALTVRQQDLLRYKLVLSGLPGCMLPLLLQQEIWSELELLLPDYVSNYFIDFQVRSTNALEETYQVDAVAVEKKLYQPKLQCFEQAGFLPKRLDWGVSVVEGCFPQSLRLPSGFDLEKFGLSLALAIRGLAV